MMNRDIRTGFDKKTGNYYIDEVEYRNVSDAWSEEVLAFRLLHKTLYSLVYLIDKYLEVFIESHVFKSVAAATRTRNWLELRAGQAFKIYNRLRGKLDGPCLGACENSQKKEVIYD